MDVYERFELIFGIGAIVISVLFYVILGIIFFVVSSKKKEKDPKDAKTWKTIGIVCMCIAGFALVTIVGTMLLGAIVAALSETAVFLM